MKFVSLFTHFPAFHPPVDEPTFHTARSTAATREGEPTFVFRGHPCQKGQPVIATGVQPPHRVFRGTAYSRALVLSGLDIPEQKGAVRVFRGRIVPES